NLVRVDAAGVVGEVGGAADKGDVEGEGVGFEARALGEDDSGGLEPLARLAGGREQGRTQPEADVRDVDEVCLEVEELTGLQGAVVGNPFVDFLLAQQCREM